MFDDLNDSNFKMFAMKYYENVNCTHEDDFNDDLKRIHYIKRLFKKYKETGELKERLIINHLIVLYNMFYHKALTRMLLLKLKEDLNILKPFLVFLSYWDTNVGKVNGKIIIDIDIGLDPKIIKKLREIKYGH